MRQIELETSSLTLSCGRQWLQVVLGLPDVHEGGWRLLFGQVLLPELLVPGYKPTPKEILKKFHPQLELWMNVRKATR